ncbi:MAG: insulinase family protein [Holophagaceae bacterium]|nr:insulinase family protein [Holophagaceae bacterium]
MRAPAPALLSALLPTLLIAQAPTKPAPKAPAAKSAPAASPKALPFPIHQKTLANGLKVAVIPTGMPNLVSLQIPVSTGSRNEVEPGKSGFAHFFEHMMFRGTPTVDKDLWNATLQRTGASQNAYTSDDLTNYHTLFSKDDLETWIRLEADRFQHLAYSEEGFKTESRAVLGEYNKNSANPISKLFEVQRNAAFTTHTYKHTTMGFLKDIEDMPNQFAYSKQFFARWYKPENVSVIVTGDVDPEATFKLVEKYFGPWKRGAAKPPAIPVEPEPKGPVTAHVPWDSPTLPWMTVAFHAPTKYSVTDNSALALALAGDQLFGSQSELYQRLVVKEQKVNALFAGGGDSKDPELFTIGAQVKKAEDMAYVRDLILDTCAKGVALPFSAARLADAKQEGRLTFQRALDSTNAVAGLVARLSSFERDPEAVNKLAALRETVKVEDLARVAKATFRDNARVITTLAHGPLPEALNGEVTGVQTRAAKLAELPQLRLLEEPNPASALVNLRVAFRVGSIHDPVGRKGLAQLTASMVADAGTRSKSLTELTKAYAATGTGLGALVDKERTSFILNAPKAKAAEAVDLALEQLVETGFKEEDFRRLKARQLNALKVGLKANNDEELGKLALEARMYAGAYASPVLGTESGLEAITLDDVKAFAKAYYTRPRLLVGLGGGFDADLKAKVLRGLAPLADGESPKVMVSEAEHVSDGSHLFIVTKETRATAISIGIPLRERNDQGAPIEARVNRAHPDFAALWVATSHLGQHRDSTGVLYQRLRELRGLNYGNYAYLEAFPGGMFQFQPAPGVARWFNHWQIWIRPVDPKHGAFALKAALFELDKLVRNGVTEKEFEASRTFLVKFLDHLNDTGGKKLGHDMDMAGYGLPADYAGTMKAKLRALTATDVNRAIRKYLRTTNLDLAVITKDAEAFQKDLFAEASPLPKYDSPKPDLKAEDEAIARFRLDVDPKNIATQKLEELFK